MISEQGPLSPAVKAEAAAWLAHIQSPQRSPAMEASLRQWLAASSEHARAFELASESWELVARRPEGRPLRASRALGPRWVIPLPRLAAVAAICMLAFGAVLYFRDAGVSTSIGEQRAMTLEDGTRVVLNTDTRLIVQYDAEHRQLTLESGEALFDVAREASRPFVVLAGSQRIRALGTSFVVRNDARAVAVTLMEGKVSVEPAAAHPSSPAARLLDVGERFTVFQAGAARVDKPVLSEITAWQRGEVVLDHTRLADAVDEMNRYNDAVELSLAEPRMGNIVVSGSFRAGDSLRFAEAVADTYGLELVRKTRQIVIAGQPPKSQGK